MGSPEKFGFIINTGVKLHALLFERFTSRDLSDFASMQTNSYCAGPELYIFFCKSGLSRLLLAKIFEIRPGYAAQYKNLRTVFEMHCIVVPPFAAPDKTKGLKGPDHFAGRLIAPGIRNSPPIGNSPVNDQQTAPGTQN